MSFDKAARTIIGVTALAWSIPLAQANETRQPRMTRAHSGNAAFMKLDAGRNGCVRGEEQGAVVGPALRK